MKDADDPLVNRGQVLQAYKAAVKYYLNRNNDGSLRHKKDVAHELGIKPPRFSEFLRMAWQMDMVKVSILPPEGYDIPADSGAIAILEDRLLNRLQKLSPPLLDKSGKVVRQHKLTKIHIVPDAVGGIPEDMVDAQYTREGYESVASRICRKAGQELRIIIESAYKDYRQPNQDILHVGIGWGRTCEKIVDLFPVPEQGMERLRVCPFVGLIGNEQTTIDANFLAYRLGARLSAKAVKLPCPITQKIDMAIDEVRQIKQALNWVNHCKIGVSGVSLGHDIDGQNRMRLRRRKVIDDAINNKLARLKAAAEINCHWFDINGKHIPFEKLGFKSIGIGVEEMRRMPRMMIVVGPEKWKALPAVISVKAGVCSDIVLDHNMAREILDPRKAGKFGI